MPARFPFSDRDKNKELWVDVSQLPLDLKRILSVQFREFIHHIEDSEPENTITHSPRVLNFLERCYGKAA